MSITTRQGDSGETALLFGRRVPKSHPLVVAVGAVDELNASLGLARVTLTSDDTDGFAASLLGSVQQDLVALMGELSVLPEDLPRYEASGFSKLTGASLDRLDEAARKLESDGSLRIDGWAMPGAGGSAAAAQLDFARTVCRRAESQLWALEPPPEHPGIFLNRLADVLWLLARVEETTTG